MASAFTGTKQADFLQTKLSSTSKVLLSPDSPEWRQSSNRFSDVGRLTPSAIIQPSCEADVVATVQHALKHKIPFVGKSGGHSQWSNIGEGGWVIDFAKMDAIVVSRTDRTVTLGSGVNAKSLSIAVGEAGCVVATPAAATVGMIPALLGGGKSLITALYGVSCDSLISARVMTAKHGLVVASATENSDLFWALKGAGQLFGLVIEITMKIYPMKEKILEMTFIFPAAKVAPVAAALESMCKEENRSSPWSVVIAAAPGATSPMLVVATKHFRPESEADAAVQGLVVAGPLQTIRRFTDWGQSTDSSEALNKSGGMWNMFSCGLQKFDGQKLIKGVEGWKEMTEKSPATVGSFYLFDWGSLSGMKDHEGDGSAWAHRDCESWAMAYTNGPDEETGRVAKDHGERFIYMCQEDQRDDERALFPNHTRLHSLEQRYRGVERQRKLKDLKRTWDPEGVFTRQFLD